MLLLVGSKMVFGSFMCQWFNQLRSFCVWSQLRLEGCSYFVIYIIAEPTAEAVKILPPKAEKKKSKAC